VDRSGNAANAITAGTGESYYFTSGAAKYAALFDRFTSANKGGSGSVTGSTGFYWCFKGRITADYPYLFSDSTDITNGRRISYESYAAQLLLTVGTGTQTRTPVAVTGLAPLNINPNIEVIAEAYQDATTIYLRVNSGPWVSAPCAPCTPGGLNYSVNGGTFPNPGYSSGDMREQYHTCSSPLTPALREGVRAYIATK
jgi:hypothetical protein